MNAITSGFLVAGLLVVAAVYVGWRTWRVTRSSVLWMRPVDSRIAHAIPRRELRAGLTEVEAVARCARWPVAVLVGDAHAERCRACVRRVERAERGRR